MFKTRTLIVLGAGAGHEIGMPVGIGLAATIAGKLDVKFDDWGRELISGDRSLFEQILRLHREKANAYQKAAWTIRDGVLLSNSIDDFLDVHSQDAFVQEIGKAAIVRSILEAERHSKLYVDSSNVRNKMNLDTLINTWFVKFVRMLGRNVQHANLDAIFDNVVFINFNYDRCVEYFLLHALRSLHSIDESRALSILSKLKVIHPYGQVGPLSAASMGVRGVPFGGNLPHSDPPYFELARAIKTYTEQLNDENELEGIREEVERADRIIFLGFAFHEQNVGLLKPRNTQPHKQIFATAVGMSASDIEVVTAQLQSFFDPGVRYTVPMKIEQQLTCSELFDSYNRSLPA